MNRAVPLCGTFRRIQEDFASSQMGPARACSRCRRTAKLAMRMKTYFSLIAGGCVDERVGCNPAKATRRRSTRAVG